MVTDQPIESTETDESSWPAEVAMIISALEAGRHRILNRRSVTRQTHRVKARLRLFSDKAGDEPWLLYTREASERGVGFVTRHRLPLGYGGTVELATPFGGVVVVTCTIYRCRETSPGWYEGALTFNREQWLFGAKR